MALELADLADAITMPRFRATDLVVATKPDFTPVSDADRAAEEAIRRRLEEACPGDAVIGEELGETAGEKPAAGRRWVLDPVDGTKNFVRGIPVWASLIALEADGVPVVGVVSAPALGRRWWAARGSGAFAACLPGLRGPNAEGGSNAFDAEPIRVSAVAGLGDAQLSYDSLTEFEDLGLGQAALELERRCWRSRGFGDFWSHVLVAEGAVDVGVEPDVSIWDIAPLLVIVEEAGGRFTDLAGRARADGGSAVSTNGLLHDEVLGIFGTGEPGR